MHLQIDQTQLARLAAMPETLKYEGEFGAELVTFIPFVYWCHCIGLFKGRKVSTYKGMRPLYYFLGDDQVVERDDTRHWVPFAQRKSPDQWLVLPNANEHTSVRSPMEYFPDYRSAFSTGELTFDKPLVVIHNKYNLEWNNEPPRNFFSLEDLEEMFNLLKGGYQVVYIRHGMGGVSQGYSLDHNQLMDFGDADLLTRHPEVLSFNALHERFKDRFSVNAFKAALYAKSYRFISVQGGGAYQCAMYSGSGLLIYHKDGPEIHHSYSKGFFTRTANPAPLLLVATNRAELMAGVQAIGSGFVFSGRFIPGSKHINRMKRLSPHRFKPKRPAKYGMAELPVHLVQ